MNITVERTNGQHAKFTFTGTMDKLRNAIDNTCDGQWTTARYDVDGVRCAIRNTPHVFTEQTIDNVTYTVRG